MPTSEAAPVQHAEGRRYLRIATLMPLLLLGLFAMTHWPLQALWPSGPLTVASGYLFVFQLFALPVLAPWLALVWWRCRDRPLARLRRLAWWTPAVLAAAGALVSLLVLLVENAVDPLAVANLTVGLVALDTARWLVMVFALGSVNLLAVEFAVWWRMRRGAPVARGTAAIVCALLIATGAAACRPHPATVSKPARTAAKALDRHLRLASRFAADSAAELDATYDPGCNLLDPEDPFVIVADARVLMGAAQGDSVLARAEVVSVAEVQLLSDGPNEARVTLRVRTDTSTWALRRPREDAAWQVCAPSRDGIAPWVGGELASDSVEWVPAGASWAAVRRLADSVRAARR